MYLFITDVKQEWYCVPPLHARDEGRGPESIRGVLRGRVTKGVDPRRSRRVKVAHRRATCVGRAPPTFRKCYFGRCSALVPLDLWSVVFFPDFIKIEAIR